MAALHLAGRLGDKPVTFPLDAPTLSIGRSSKNPVHLPDGTVSKEHAEIIRQGERWLVRDLGSRNGTRLNGREVHEPVEIKPGDRLEIGHVELTVHDGTPVSNMRLSDATVVGSSLRLKTDQILERRSRSGSSSLEMVHLLAEAGRLLVLPRPLRETCEELLTFVEKAVPAGRHILLLRETPDAEPVQIAARSRKGRADQPLALSRSIMRMVLDECASVITGDARSDPRFEGQQSIVMQAVRSAMAVPLFDDERVLGLIYVDSQDPGQIFGNEQLELLTLLANMAAVKISNARLLEDEQVRARMKQEMDTAARIQRSLLPGQPPRLDGYAFDAFLETCHEVGGDLYDFHVAADGRVLFLLGDVTGKGMGAALLMSSFLSSARVLYEAIPDLGQLATRLGAIVDRSTDAVHYVTGFIGRLDPATGVLEYVNAGHPAPVVVGAGTLRELESTGVPFGILSDFTYEAARTELRPGETLAIFSDGIPEAQSGEDFFETERLHQALQAGDPSDLLAVRGGVLSAVREFVGDGPRGDDITLLLVRRQA
jgi:sigma-B regulation protein RsbU (phosphoserine phosphatase)